MNTNIGRLMSLINCGNCKVIDGATSPEEKDKVFIVQRKKYKYPLQLDFDNLIKNGYVPVSMNKFESRDEIIFKFVK